MVVKDTPEYRNATTFVPGTPPSPVQATPFRNKTVVVPGTPPSPVQTAMFRNKTTVVPATAPAADSVSSAPKATAFPVYP